MPQAQEPVNPDALFAYALRYSNRRAKPHSFPTFREAAKRFRTNIDEIESAIDSYQGRGFMGAAVAFGGGGGFAEIKSRGNYLIEVEPEAPSQTLGITKTQTKE